MQLPITQLGNRRQKKTRSSIIEQLAQQAAQKRNLGKFAKLGQGRSVRSNNPFGSGGRFGALRGTGRPQMLGNRGMGRSGEMMERLFGGGAAPFVGATQGALPTDYLGGPEAPVQEGPQVVNGVPQVVTPESEVPTFGGGPQTPSAPTGDPEQDAVNAGTMEDMFVQSWGPSSQGTVGGMIPLGGGLYLNPSTGQIMGGGLGNRGYEMGL